VVEGALRLAQIAQLQQDRAQARGGGPAGAARLQHLGEHPVGQRQRPGKSPRRRGQRLGAGGAEVQSVRQPLLEAAAEEVEVWVLGGQGQVGVLPGPAVHRVEGLVHARQVVAEQLEAQALGGDLHKGWAGAVGGHHPLQGGPALLDHLGGAVEVPDAGQVSGEVGSGGVVVGVQVAAASQQADVALVLAQALADLPGGAEVDDRGLQAADPVQAGHQPGADPLVDDTAPVQVGGPAQQPVEQHRLPQAGLPAEDGLRCRVWVAGLVQGQQEGVGVPALRRLTKQRPRAGGQALVGVQDQYPVARGGLHRGVAGRGEVVVPGPVQHPRAQRSGELRGPVLAAGVHHHDLVYAALYRGQAGRQVVGLISHDHAQRDRRSCGLQRLARCLLPAPAGEDVAVADEEAVGGEAAADLVEVGEDLEVGLVGVVQRNAAQQDAAGG
jgi:hypothetical protein